MKLLCRAAFLIATTCALLPAGEAAASENPCAVLKNIGQDQEPDDYDGRWKNFVSWIYPNLGKPDQPENPNDTGPADLFFTTRSGYTIQPTCLEGGISARTKGLYYPIGTVVRILGDARIGNENLKLIETEYGIRTFIPEADLTPLARQKIYFFANSPDLPVIDCVNTDCDLKQRARSGQVLHPRLQFAAADLSAMTGKLSDDGIPQCQKIAVELFTSAAPTESANRGRIDLCVRDGQGNAGFDARIKVASHQYYEKLFNVKISGALVDTDNAALSVVLPRMQNAKDCGQADIVRTTGSVGVGAEIKIPIYVFNLSSQAKVMNEWQRIRTTRDSLYIRYGSYAATLFDRETPAVPLQSLFKCDEDRLDPERPIKFSLMNPISDSLSISFRVPDVTKIFKEINVETFLPSLSTRHVTFRKGHLWKINDHIRYFQLRDTINQIVQDEVFDAQLQLMLGEQDKPLERKKLTAFLTHLILLATTEFG